eukprot:CAMPEP_0170451074 /NCGR_PEP_ID=MMETSP0123-20130129/429_1 /TAXON_ID=182087 /ORGANISM="Favella ehrenbergii, Strain Fehren 1" /LENGTH=62 /DNA_ID=CAMNT_0010712629 /DNA_START=591 /DNA_END=775 /DNA_ORIENTATION=+
MAGVGETATATVALGYASGSSTTSGTTELSWLPDESELEVVNLSENDVEAQEDRARESGFAT